MSEGSISQAEIDALLSGVDTGGLSASGSTKSAPQIDLDIPTLSKFAEGLKDKLAANLGTMTGVEVTAGAPTVGVWARPIACKDSRNRCRRHARFLYGAERRPPLHHCA